MYANDLPGDTRGRRQHRDAGRKYRRCDCPIWIDGTVEHREVPRVTGYTPDWEEASKQKTALEAQLEKPRDSRTTIAEAGEKFIADGNRGRRLADATVKKYELLFARLNSFAAARRIEFLRGSRRRCANDVSACAQRARRAATALKTLERLRAFLGFALERKWISENPARKLKAPKIPERQTLPYTQDEMIPDPGGARRDLRQAPARETRSAFAPSFCCSAIPGCGSAT